MGLYLFHFFIMGLYIYLFIIMGLVFLGDIGVQCLRLFSHI